MSEILWVLVIDLSKWRLWELLIRFLLWAQILNGGYSHPWRFTYVPKPNACVQLLILMGPKLLE